MAKKQEEEETQGAGFSEGKVESWKEATTGPEYDRHFQVQVDFRPHSTE